MDDYWYWAERGRCRELGDASMFFPSRGQSSEFARAFCRACPVRVLCAAYAIAHNESQGVWGALSAYQRRAIDPEHRRRIKKLWRDMHGKEVIESE